MKTYEFTFWIKTPSDSKDTASTIGYFTCKASNPKMALKMWPELCLEYLARRFGGEVGLSKYRAAGWGRKIRLVDGAKPWSKEF